MVTAMIIIFILGYILIALEHKTGINKAAIALVLGMVLWSMYVFASPTLITSAHAEAFRNYLTANPNISALSLAEQVVKYVVNIQVIEHLGDIAEILFYLLGAMTIVELIDIHGGFAIITNHISTKRKKKLLWLLALITFFMSSVLDNLTTAIVMVMLLKKLVDEEQERWIFGSIIILAANAGGAWTPIGDVTTIMLWINDNITSGTIMQSLFLPSILSLALPTWIISRSLKGTFSSTQQTIENQTITNFTSRERFEILIIGILCLLSVPVFKSLTNLPPFMGILLALGCIWIYVALLYKHKRGLPEAQQHRIPEILSKVDMPTILFFLGILMSVAALEAIGVLNNFSVFLNDKIHNVYLISTLIGFLSSVIDNVPLVAASMGMYPVVVPDATTSAYMLNFVQDGVFWELIAYCAGVGGSILIIGSAAGVVVMGLERINFIWYLKNISLVAILGYLAGIGLYIVQKLLL